MTRLINYAFRNIWRSRVRTIALLTIISIGVTVLVLIAAGYEDLFDSASMESVAKDGDMLFVNEAEAGIGSMSWESYLSVKAKLMASGVVKGVRASTIVEGIVGSVDRSAPCSGLAVENGVKSGDGIIGVTLGESLAKTLGVSQGEMLGGLINDCGMTLRLEKTVKTESLLKDRFYLEIPVEAFLERDEAPEVSSISIWLNDGVSSPMLNADSDSRGYRDALAFCSSIPELENYTLNSMPKKNTRVDQIVQIYRTNYRVVLVVVALTLFLAFLNVLALSVYERQQELGTLRSIGTPIIQIRFLLLCETLMIAILSWIIGITVSEIASVLINANGGLVFAAPPGETSDITVGSKLSVVNMLQIGAVIVLGALAASFISAMSLSKSSVVQQLEVRD